MIRALKKLFDTYPKMNIDRIKKEVASYQVVSFDIFDTLLKRDIWDEHDVYLMVEKKFNRENNQKLENFKKIRLAAELEARRSSMYEEVTIDEIYQYVVGKRDDSGFLIDNKTAYQLKCDEKCIENQVCVVNDDMLSILDYCRNIGKRIIITSDMYLDKGFVEKMLKDRGVLYYDEIYLSSDYRVQKKTGKLYLEIIKKEGVSSKSIVHIGDNKISDFLMPKMLGVKSILIPHRIIKTSYIHTSKQENLQWRNIKAFINNRIGYVDGNYTRIGYEVYGPLLFVFSKWLVEKLDPKKTTLFFARDCYVIKTAYEIITSNSNTIYFLGSRKSLTNALLYDNTSISELKKVIRSEPSQMTLSGLLDKIGESVQDYSKEIDKFGMSADYIINRDHIQDDKRFVEFYECIKDDIKKHAEQKYDNFLKYWESLGISSDIQVVDIGWRATMQYCLNKLIPGNQEIKGYYLGLKEDALVTDCEGLYLNGIEEFEKECFLAGSTALIELFFSAPHGSVVGYDDNGEAELMPYEYEDLRNDATFIREIQNGALRFVREYSRTEIMGYFDAQPDILFCGLSIFSIKPGKEQLKLIGDFPFQMGVGIGKIAAPKRLSGYICHPRKFLFDFVNSTWKIGFLKRCFRVSLPYYSIFRRIYRYGRG